MISETISPSRSDSLSIPPIRKRDYQLKYFLPFNCLLFMVCCPFLSLIRARKPCLRFCTLLDGLNVLLGAPNVADAENDRVCIDGAESMDVPVDVTDSGGSLGWDVIERQETPRARFDMEDRVTVVCSGVRDLLIVVVGVLRMVENALRRVSFVVSSRNCCCTFGSAPGMSVMAWCRICILPLFHRCDTSWRYCGGGR